MTSKDVRRNNRATDLKIHESSYLAGIDVLRVSRLESDPTSGTSADNVISSAS
jgi:hypothetical protein